MQLDVGSVRRVIMRAKVSSVTFTQPCSASSCILYKEAYIRRANQPSMNRSPLASPPIMLPTVLKSPSDTSEPKSR